jgi:hypothetical protein
MTDLGLRAICVNCASKAQSANGAEAKRRTSAQSGLNHPLKSSDSYPPTPGADASQSCRYRSAHAGGAGRCRHGHLAGTAIHLPTAMGSQGGAA